MTATAPRSGNERRALKDVPRLRASSKGGMRQLGYQSSIAIMREASQDTGATAKVVREMLPRPHYATGQDRCAVEVRDYRDLCEPESFDKIVSVGMFENVGESHLPEYFDHVRKLLRSGGVFLNHGTAAPAIFHRKGPSFIEKYVFPDLAPIGAAIRIAEACGFEVRDGKACASAILAPCATEYGGWNLGYEDAKRIASETVYRMGRISWPAAPGPLQKNHRRVTVELAFSTVHPVGQSDSAMSLIGHCCAASRR